MGSVIIDSIEIVKVVGLLGTNLEDLENSDFHRNRRIRKLRFCALILSKSFKPTQGA